MIKINSVEFVVGKTGTGKTRTLIELAFSEALKGKKVLFLNDEMCNDSFHDHIFTLLLQKLDKNNLADIDDLEFYENLFELVLHNITFVNGYSESPNSQHFIDFDSFSLAIFDYYQTDIEGLVYLKNEFPHLQVVASMQATN